MATSVGSESGRALQSARAQTHTFCFITGKQAPGERLRFAPYGYGTNVQGSSLKLMFRDNF